MGKASLILVLGAIFLFGISNYERGQSLVEATETTSVDYSQKKARDIANGTAQMVLAKLSDSTGLRINSPRTATVFDGDVTYTAKDTILPGYVFIHVATTATYEATTKSVSVLTRPEVPKFFEYAAASGGDLVVNGLNDLFRDAFNPLWNANVHTNSNMIFNPNNFIMKGFATYTGSYSANGGVTISPNQNPQGLPVRYWAPAVTIPAFNAASYAGIATTTFGGDKTYNGGSIAMSANKYSPSIIYVNGKLTFEGTVTVTGYGVFVSTGDVELKGSVLVSPVDSLNSKIGMYTNGKITVSVDNIIVHAQMFSVYEVGINGLNTQIFGSITTIDKCTFNAQGIKLYYKPALNSLTDPFWGKQTRRLVAQHHFE